MTLIENRPAGSVDIIVPAHNYARFLPRCVESVLSQAGVVVRVLIIDDASSDDSAEVAAALAARDERVEFRRHLVNHGHIATYNEGLDWAAQSYTVVLSADDMLTPGALFRAVRLMNRYPEIGMTYGRHIAFNADQSPPKAPPVPDDYEWRIVGGSEFLESCCATGSNPVPAPTPVVRTWLQKELGGYRKELPHSADMEMWMRFAAHASLGLLDTAQAFYGRHRHNMTCRYRDIHDLKQRQQAFEILFEKHGDRIPGRERLEQLANRQLAEEAFWAGYQAFDHGDPALCGIYLDFALRTCPAACSGRSWSRLQWKRLMGPRIWSTVRPLVRRMTAVGARLSAPCV